MIGGVRPSPRPLRRLETVLSGLFLACWAVVLVCWLRLVSLAGNQTLAIVAEMLNEIVARAVAEVSRADGGADTAATRRRGIRSQKRLIGLIRSGD